MPRYKITIEYDGTNFAGWQKQHHAKTIQQTIEDAIFSMSQERVDTIVAGRTDTGVHARAQVAHFDIEKDFTEYQVRQGLNFYLPKDGVSVISAEKVAADFNARFDAKKRYYKYYILNRQAPSPLDRLRAWHVYDQLDMQKMQAAVKHLEGTHNFNSFRSTECQAKNPVRSIDYINICREGDYIIFELCARSFLHNMVRNIVGTLKQVGTGHIAPEKLEHIIKAENRTAAGMCAPAHGLFFERVDY